MPPKKQFQTAQQRRTFYDRKVLHYGYSTTISMGKIIPKTWKYVRVRLLEHEGNTITVSIEKLLGELENARGAKDDKRDR